MTSPADSPYLTTEHAAAHLDTTPAALRKRVREGSIPDWTWKRFGRRQYRFIRAALDQWMQEDAKQALRLLKKSTAA